MNGNNYYITAFFYSLQYWFLLQYNNHYSIPNVSYMSFVSHSPNHNLFSSSLFTLYLTCIKATFLLPSLASAHPCATRTSSQRAQSSISSLFYLFLSRSLFLTDQQSTFFLFSIFSRKTTMAQQPKSFHSWTTKETHALQLVSRLSLAATIRV